MHIAQKLRKRFKYVPYEDRKNISNDLKPIYKAVKKKGSDIELDAFDEKSSKIYIHTLSSIGIQIGKA